MGEHFIDELFACATAVDPTAFNAALKHETTAHFPTVFLPGHFSGGERKRKRELARGFNSTRDRDSLFFKSSAHSDF